MIKERISNSDPDLTSQGAKYNFKNYVLTDA